MKEGVAARAPQNCQILWVEQADGAVVKCLPQQDSLVRRINAPRLRGNRNDFAALHLQNLLVFEPGKHEFANVSLPQLTTIN